MKLNIEVNGDTATSERLKTLGDQAQNMKPVFEVIGRIMAAGIKNNFNSQGSLFGGSWKPDAKSTLERKAKANQGSQVLRVTGRLQRSAQDPFVKISKTQVRVGITDPVARILQPGTTKGSIIPARRLVGLAKGQRDHVTELALKHLMQ